MTTNSSRTSNQQALIDDSSSAPRHDHDIAVTGWLAGSSDPRPSGARPMSVLSYCTQPLVHTLLLSWAIYFQWTFTAHAAWSAAFLATSFLALLLTPKRRNPEEPSPLVSLSERAAQYVPMVIRIESVPKWLFMLGVLVAAPTALGAIHVLPWYFGLYSSACVTLALLSGRLSKRPARWQRKAPAEDIAGGSPRATAACFCLATMWISYGLLTAWPYLAAHCVSVPGAIASAISYVERSVDTPGRAFPFGSLSAAGCGDSFALTTRGQQTALVGNSLHPRFLLLSAEQLHLLFFALLLCTGVTRSVLLLPGRKRFTSAMCDLLAIAVVFVLYLTCTWWDVLSGRMPPVLWRHAYLALLCITFLWFTIRTLLVAMPRLGATERTPAPITLTVPPFASRSTAIAASVLCLGVSLLWHEPGVAKSGHILIDEGHSDWEKSDLPMEADFYGVKTVYNYAFLKELLEKHYPSVVSNYKPLTPDVLEKCDVLVLKTPTKPYGASEAEAIKHFVAGGGGVWLIGDHTNIFGMNTYLNQISGLWGIYFHADAVQPLDHYYQRTVRVDGVEPYHSCGKRNHDTLYSRAYLNHPVIGHNIPYLTVLTSCSVSAPLGCEHISISRGTYRDHALFGGNTFFGNLSHDDDEDYGCVLQDVAVKSGHGRVAVWSDSTLFSNFSMCMSGVPELALGYINWLNRRNLIDSSVYKGVIVLQLGVLLGLLAWARTSALGALYGALVGIVSVCGSIPAIDRVNTNSYAIGDARKGFHVVGFEEQYSNIALPNKDHVHEYDRNVFETFYVLTQRFHWMPLSADRIRDLAACDCIVIINPVRALEDGDMACLRRVLARGGSLVIMFNREMQSYEGAVATAERLNRLLGGLGIADVFEVSQNVVLTDFYGDLVSPGVYTDAELVARIKVASPRTRVLLKCAEGDAIATSQKVGKGRVLMCSAADLYCNASIGQTGGVPSGRQATLLKSYFRFMGEVMPRDRDDRESKALWEKMREQASPSEPETN